MKNLLQQHNIKGIGMIISVLYLTSPLIGIGMYVVNAMTFYTVASYNIHKIFPWMNLFWFLLILAFTMIVLLLIFYVLVYASYQAFINKQAYIHNNPIEKDLKAIKKKLGIADD